MARCVRVIDLGVQKDDGMYGTKIQHKLMLCWELPTETHVFREENGPEPFMLSSEYTMFLSEKANLRKDLESWRGRPFTPEELEAFDVGKLLGVPCLLNVVHKTAKNGNVYGNVKGITPMPKGMQCPPAISKLVKYEIEMGRNEIFASLPEWVQNKIAACEDWKAKPAPNEAKTPPQDDGPDVEPDQPF